MAEREGSRFAETSDAQERRNLRLFWFLLCCASLALFIGPLQFADERPRILPAGGLANSRFQPDAVDPSTDGHQRLNGLATRGSWHSTPESVGEHLTEWYTARPKFIVLVAGYPRAQGNRLQVEAEGAEGRIESIDFADRDPHETWEPWYVSVPAQTKRIRIRATSDAVAAQGWFAFSEPYTLRTRLEWQALSWAQLATTTVLALVVLCGPGLAWLGRRAHPDVSDIAAAALFGPLLLTLDGLLVWICGGLIAPALGSRLLIAGILVGLASQVRCLARSLPRFPSGATATMAASALLVGFCVGKANVAVGVPGELYSGLVSRSLEVGGHSDSRVPFHVVQAVSHHLAPFGPVASAYFSPWSFASRGPLAGLIAAPVVLATGADVPREMPDQPWRPFDRQGFAAYRITLMALASLAGWLVFGVAAALMGPRWGLATAATALLTPFFVHEMYFTWPKLIAAGFSIYSFLLASQRRPFSAGLILGFGYLFHPLPLLSAPFVAAWIFGYLAWFKPEGLRRALWAATAFALAIVIVIGAWQGATFAMSGTTAQAGFAQYITMADSAPATWSSWWTSRWHNFAYTFIPFYQLSAPAGHESLNSVYAPSPAWVRAAFLYWSTLPFALGLPTTLLAGYAFARGFRAAKPVWLLLVFAPTALLLVYWGASETGMIRYCGHVLFLSVLLATFYSHSRLHAGTPNVQLPFFGAAWGLVRTAEILLMAFGTTLANGFPHFAGPFAINDLVSFAIALVCLAFAAITVTRTATSAFCPVPSANPSPS